MPDRTFTPDAVVVPLQYAVALKSSRAPGDGGIALTAAIANLSGILSSQVTWRGSVQIHNDPFLTVPWSESLNASLPSTTPAFTAWWGHVQPLPMVYIAWFLIPVLAFIGWRAARSAARDLSGPVFFAVAVLMWTAGPGAISPLRWPARVLPMLAIVLLVLVYVRRSGTEDLV